MSRSPVREALIRLAGDDLVVTLSNRSTVVAPIDLQSFPEIRRGAGHRAADEHPAGRRTAQRGRPQAIARRQKEFVAAVHNRQPPGDVRGEQGLSTWPSPGRAEPLSCAFYDRLLNQGRRMLHLHFAYLERARRLSADRRT
jgi:hypothetical protein